MKKPQPIGVAGAKLIAMLRSPIQSECSTGVNGRAPAAVTGQRIAANIAKLPVLLRDDNQLMHIFERWTCESKNSTSGS